MGGENKAITGHKELCAIFNCPAGAELSSKFNQGGHDFLSKSGTYIKVFEQSGEKCIKIPPPGISVKLFKVVDRVSFRAGHWTEDPITVTVFDTSGNVLASIVFTSRDMFSNSSIDVVGIASVDFDTTGEEAYLVSLCIDI